MTEELKDLEGLSNHAMITLCERWLQDPRMRAHFEEYDLGIAVRARLREVYRHLAELRAPHLGFELRQLERVLDRPRDELIGIAKRLHRALESRIVQAPDSATAERYQELHDVLFPDGPMSLASLSRRMGGNSEFDHRRDERQADDGAVTRLQSVPVTGNTLAEAYRVWAIVEETIEKRRRDRTQTHPLLDAESRLYKSTQRARALWLKTARSLFTAVALLPVSDQVRAELFSSLADSVSAVTSEYYRVSSVDSEQPTLPDFQRPDVGSSLSQRVDEGDEDTLEFDPADIDGPDDLAVTS